MADLGDTLDRLKRDGFLDETVEPAAMLAQMSEREPWFIKLITGFGAWVGALFLVLSMSMFLERDVLSFVTFGGLALMAGAFLQHQSALFARYLGTALGVCGQWLVIGAFFEDFGDLHRTAAACFVALTTYPFYQSATARFLMTGTALTFCVYQTSLGTSPWPLCLFLCLVLAGMVVCFEFSARKPWLRPLAFALLVTVLVLPSFSLADRWAAFELWLPANLVAVLGMWVLLVRGKQTARFRTTALVIGAVLGLIAGPGVMISLLVLMLGFGRAEERLLGLGVATILYYMVAWYYAMEMDLAQKSYLLMGAGAAMLVVRQWLKTRLAAVEVAS